MIGKDTMTLIGVILLVGLAIFAILLEFAPVSWWVRSKDRKKENFNPDTTHWKLDDELWIFDGYECYPTYWGCLLIAFDEKGCVVKYGSKLMEFNFETNKKYRFHNESMNNRLNPNSENNSNNRILLEINKYKNHRD